MWASLCMCVCVYISKSTAFNYLQYFCVIIVSHRSLTSPPTPRIYIYIKLRYVASQDCICRLKQNVAIFTFMQYIYKLTLYNVFFSIACLNDINYRTAKITSYLSFLRWKRGRKVLRFVVVVVVVELGMSNIFWG